MPEWKTAVLSASAGEADDVMGLPWAPFLIARGTDDYLCGWCGEVLVTGWDTSRHPPFDVPTMCLCGTWLDFAAVEPVTSADRERWCSRRPEIRRRRQRLWGPAGLPKILAA